MSDPGFDSLFETLAEVASDDTPVAEILRVGEELHHAGVRAAHVRKLISAGVTVTLGEGGPRLEQPRQWFPAIQHWAVGCRACGAEVKRGELGNLGKLRDQSWVVECAACRPLDPRSERADNARKRAIEKDDDPEELIQRMIDLAPRELRELIEDLLLVVVAAREGS